MAEKNPKQHNTPTKDLPRAKHLVEYDPGTACRHDRLQQQRHRRCKGGKISHREYEQALAAGMRDQGKSQERGPCRGRSGDQTLAHRQRCRLEGVGGIGRLAVGVRGEDKGAIERFTRELIPLVLNGPPSVTGFAAGRPKVEEIVAYWPALIDKRVVQTKVEVLS